MAASVLDLEDSIVESHRTSLLEVIEDSNRTVNKRNPMSGFVTLPTDGTEVDCKSYSRNYMYYATNGSLSKQATTAEITAHAGDSLAGVGKVKRQSKKPEKREQRHKTSPPPRRNYFETVCLDVSDGRQRMGVDGHIHDCRSLLRNSGRASEHLFVSDTHMLVLVPEMKNLVHRLVYIGKLTENVEDRTDVGYHHESLVKNLQNNFQTEPITGLMLVYLKHIVHVVEASSDMITEIMRDVVKTQRMNGGSFLEQAKILVISHDVSTRLYQQWNFRTLDIQAARMEAYETAEADKVVMDLLSQLLKLGNKLAITPKISLKTTLDSLHEKFPDLLPQQAHLHYLMEENDSTMILPEQYLDIYDKPFDITLESELVWPLATKLFPYN